MITLEYSSNNSGGYWWLTDKNWQDLEAAGWKVEWFKDQNREYLRPDSDGRWLGALARHASKDFETPEAGIEEWKSITGQDPWAEGCNCCGEPHNFGFQTPDGQTHYPEVQRTNSFQGWS